MCEKRKILVISASYSDESLSRSLAMEFATSAARSGDGADVEELYLPSVAFPRMTANLMNAFATGTETDERIAVLPYIEQFLGSDIYVFAIPNYNKLTSAEIVDYLNVLSLDSRIYDRASRCGGLGNKRAVIVMTSGGDSLSGEDYSFGSRYVESVLSQFGIMDIIVVRVDDTNNRRGKKKLEAAMAELQDIASDYLIY